MPKSLPARAGSASNNGFNAVVVLTLSLIALILMLAVVMVSADYSRTYGHFGERYYGQLNGYNGIGYGYNYHQGGHNGRHIAHRRPYRYGYRWYQG